MKSNQLSKIAKIIGASFMPIVWYLIYKGLYKESVEIKAEVGLTMVCVISAITLMFVLLYETYKND